MPLRPSARAQDNNQFAAGGKRGSSTRKQTKAHPMDPQIQDTDIAVIGMSGCFPLSSSLDDWWEKLCAGTELISRFSDEEMLAAGFDREALADPLWVKAAAVLGDIALFDADYFGFNPREA